MTNRAALAAAACLLSTASAASPVEYPAPVAVPHGLILTLNEQGRPSFNPADGVHQIMGGKTGPEWAAESVDWYPAADAPETRQARYSRPDFPLPRIPGDSPACDRADDRPAFCDRPSPEPPAVPLPGSGWLLLAGLAALAWVRRRC